MLFISSLKILLLIYEMHINNTVQSFFFLSLFFSYIRFTCFIFSQSGVHVHWYIVQKQKIFKLLAQEMMKYYLLWKFWERARVSLHGQQYSHISCMNWIKSMFCHHVFHGKRFFYCKLADMILGRYLSWEISKKNPSNISKNERITNFKNCLEPFVWIYKVFCGNGFGIGLNFESGLLHPFSFEKVFEN